MRLFLKNIKHDVKRAGDRWSVIKWPTTALRYLEPSKFLLIFYKRIKALEFRRLIFSQPEKLHILRIKVVASDHFKQKASWKASLKTQYYCDHIGADSLSLKWPPLGIKDDVKFAMPATKLNRHNPTIDQPRFVILTSKGIYMVDCKNWAVKESVLLSEIESLSTSNLRDGVLVIHCCKKSSSDILLRNDNLCIEFTLAVLETSKVASLSTMKISITNSISFKVDDKLQRIDFEVSPIPLVKFMEKVNESNYVVRIS